MRERRSAPREDVRGNSREGEYDGFLGKTRRAPILIAGEDGGAKVRWIYRAVNATTDAALAEMARSGELFRIDRVTELALDFIYHDPRARKFALVLPEALRHRFLEERARLLGRIAEDSQYELPEYIAEARVVIGMDGLRRYLAEDRPRHPPQEGRPQPSLSQEDLHDESFRRYPYHGTDADPLHADRPGLAGDLSPELSLDEGALEDSLMKLLEAGDRAIPVLEAALSDPTSEVRLAGAIGLAELRAVSSARALVDAYLEESSDAAPHFARLIAALGEDALQAIEARMRDELGINKRLGLAMAHLAEAGFDMEVEKLAGGDDALARTARDGLRRIMDARDAVALSSLEERLQMEGSSRLAARIEAKLRH